MLANGSSAVSAVRIRVQIADKNITIIHKKCVCVCVCVCVCHVWLIRLICEYEQSQRLDVVIVL